MKRLVILAALLALSGCYGTPQAISAQPNPYGYVCYAGFYQCTLPAQYPVGSQCSCPGIGAPSYGTVH